MKTGVGLKDKFAKQNRMTRQRLAREIVKLEKVEKSDLRMIETERKRFHLRHKNLEELQGSTVSDACNVRMYETHNPGFCYHCTGDIKETGSTMKEKPEKDSYELARSILFTNDEIDPEKVLCLHLLAAHSAKWSDEDESNVRPVTSLLIKARKKHFTGAWNNVLPCYVLDIQQTLDGRSLENVKLHENPRNLNQVDQAMLEFEERYKDYVENNAEFGKALSANEKQGRIAPSGLGKMPIISPHVYSLLGASHELRIRQALVEKPARRKFARSSMDMSNFDERSMSFNIDDEDDVFSRLTGNTLSRNWDVKSTRSPSKRSEFSPSFRVDHRITMLKSKHGRSIDYQAYRSKNYETVPKELVTIKSSIRTIDEAPSKTSSTKTPFHNMFGSRTSMHSLFSGSVSPGMATKKYRKRVYLNSSPKSDGLRDAGHETVYVLVNYQIQALVQTVLEVLERVNPEKMRMIMKTARDPEEIRKMLVHPRIQSFMQSLSGQSLLLSPESFVVSVATIIDEIDFKLEGIPDKEIIALTLEIPLVPSLESLIVEIRSNIFFDARKNEESIEKVKGTCFGADAKTGSAENGAENCEHIKCINNEVKRQIEIDDEKSSVTDPDADQNKDSPKNRITNVRKRNIPNPIKKAGYNNKSRMQTSQDKMRITRILENKSHGSAKKKVNQRESYSNNSDEEERSTSYDNMSKDISNSKAWKGAQDPSHLDADHVILRRMTNNQRILVGRMCASLKTKRINNEGLLEQRMPLAALIAPVLSRDSIKFLTRGTAYSMVEPEDKKEGNVEENTAESDKLTGSILAKIKQDVAEDETKRRLKRFLENKAE